MFETEAEEWIENNLHSTEEDYIKAFKDGAEFGYNKANEWHFVSNEELPEEMKEVLFFGIDGKFYIGLLGDHNKGWFIKVPFLGGLLSCSKPTAWRYLEPPKESE